MPGRFTIPLRVLVRNKHKDRTRVRVGEPAALYPSAPRPSVFGRVLDAF